MAKVSEINDGTVVKIGVQKVIASCTRVEVNFNVVAKDRRP